MPTPDYKNPGLLNWVPFSSKVSLFRGSAPNQLINQRLSYIHSAYQFWPVIPNSDSCRKLSWLQVGSVRFIHVKNVVITCYTCSVGWTTNYSWSFIVPLFVSSIAQFQTPAVDCFLVPKDDHKNGTNENPDVAGKKNAFYGRERDQIWCLSFLNIYYLLYGC